MSSDGDGGDGAPAVIDPQEGFGLGSDGEDQVSGGDEGRIDFFFFAFFLFFSPVFFLLKLGVIPRSRNEAW